jgi:hypothetical protein
MDNLGLYLSRILSGFYLFIHAGKQYKLIYPTIDVKYQAEIFAQKEFDNNKYNSWITDEEILQYLVENSLWTPNGDDELKKIEKTIDDLKVDLYKNFWNDAKRDSIKSQISSLRSLTNKMYHIRHSFDHLTPMGYANLLKGQYIFIHSLFNSKNIRIFKSIKNVDFYKLNYFFDLVSQNMIDISMFKKIARGDNWRSYWSANKENLFDKPAVSWTDEQKTLVVLTKMYDNAHEHPECPSDDVFEDDDAFDGWIILQKRENEELKNKNRAEKLLKGKNLDKANEVFLVAKSNKEANSIYGLNNSVGKNTIKERNKAIARGKVVKEADLPDVQRNIVAENNKKFMESRRKQ